MHGAVPEQHRVWNCAAAVGSAGAQPGQTGQGRVEGQVPDQQPLKCSAESCFLWGVFFAGVLLISSWRGDIWKPYSAVLIWPMVIEPTGYQGRELVRLGQLGRADQQAAGLPQWSAPGVVTLVLGSHRQRLHGRCSVWNYRRLSSHATYQSSLFWIHCKVYFFTLFVNCMKLWWIGRFFHYKQGEAKNQQFIFSLFLLHQNV